MLPSGKKKMMVRCMRVVGGMRGSTVRQALWFIIWFTGN